jgi:predicted dinucleotide-binding enzyme
MDLIRGIPDLRAFDGGSLENAVGMEAFAAIVLTINVKHKARVGLRLTGV